MVKLTSTPQNTPQQAPKYSYSHHIVPCDMLTYINKKYMHNRRQHRKHMSIYEWRQSLTTSKSLCLCRKAPDLQNLNEIWKMKGNWLCWANKQLSLSHSYTFITYSIIHKANLLFFLWMKVFTLRIHVAFCWLSPCSTCEISYW